MGLTSHDTQLWKPGMTPGEVEIRVLWITPGWEAEKQIIRNAVRRTWERVANVRFTGWATDAANVTPGQCVRISIHASGPGGESGSAAQGRAALRGPGQSSGSFWLTPLMPFDRLRYLAIHEFGHILGFMHEDDSPQRETQCASQEPHRRTRQIGAWDRHSVMNSGCNVYGNARGYISAGDVASVRVLFGERAVRPRGDYRGDSRTAWGVWRPSTGTWFIDDDQTGPVAWGQSGDIPVPGDYVGDGRTARAAWRPGSGTWFIDDQITAPKIWGQGGDVPVPGDYNGSGKLSRAVWRSADETWYIDDGETPPTRWGIAGDVPVPADYDGDGRTEMAVWRPATSEWFINRMNGRLNVMLGQPGDIPVPGDYLGEGRDRCALYRPSTGAWLFESGCEPAHYRNGRLPLVANGIPVPGKYGGTIMTEAAVWHPVTTRFSFANGFDIHWGQVGDVPLRHS